MLSFAPSSKYTLIIFP